MNLIYASKLYRASKRKDKICAALVNSSNAGLVQQLSEDLDEQYRQMNIENQKAKEAEKAAEEAEASGGNEQEEADGIPKSLSSGLGGSSFNPATDLVPYPEEGSEGESFEGEMPEGEESEVSEENPEEDIQESVDITASIVLDENQLNVLKGGLNLVSGLSGVTRIVNKEGEIWIYYNDDTNLNNIMTDVIEHVAKSYPNLEFNRLARSDNAIVFEIVAASSDKEPLEDKDGK